MRQNPQKRAARNHLAQAASNLRDVRQDLLPREFTRSFTIRLIVAERAGWIWLDSRSTSRSKEALNHLREILRHMPVAIPELE